MDSGSDSDQDSACSSSGEDASYNQSRQQQAPNSSQHSEYQSMIKYMQQQQQQHSDSSQQQQQQNEQSQQPMMMLPFMMPSSSSFPMMMQAQGSMPPYFGHNTSSPSSRESETATGSPLNLQTPREDRPASRSRQTPLDFQNQSRAQPFTHDQSQQQQQVVPPSSAGSHQMANAMQSSFSRSSPQTGLPCTLPNTMQMSSSHLGMNQDHQTVKSAQQSVGNFSLDFSMAAQRQEPPKPEHPAPPKRPLTPYMRFSKCMWQQVKSTNPGMSVCEIGATIGRMWRELSNEEKQKHNDDFTLDKVRYDNELKSYLKSTGLHASDLVKSKNKKKDIQSKTPIRRPPPPPQQSRPAASSLESQAQNQAQQQQQQQQLAQSFLGLPIHGMGGSLPMGVGMPMSMLPGFPQMWAAPGQQYPSQQMIASMNMAGQLQLAQQHAQGLYNNGSATALEQGVTSQLATATEGGQLHSVYLYSPNYM